METERYMTLSKRNIDALLNKNECRKAFGLLVVFLDRLEEDQKKEVLAYYKQKVFEYYGRPELSTVF
jgi:hypothetical protein